MDERYRIALYIRLSIEDGKVESLSIENQRQALHAYAETMDAENAEIVEFVDNGYSGTNFERPAVQSLLDEVREGKIRCILVKDFSRLGRNSIEVGYFMERVFPLYGVRFISLNDAFDSDTLHGDTGGINVAFKYLAAEFYSRDLSIKYKSAKFVKFRRGEYQSKICPYGYQKGANGRMEPNEETAPVVCWIFELARQGTSVSDIIKELYVRKIPTPRQYQVRKTGTHYDISRSMGIWHRSTLLRLLRDERYIGTYIMGRQEVREVGSHRVKTKDESEWIKIPDHHPAIVSKETFQEVQALLRHTKSVKKITSSHLLRGKVFCGCCGHTMARRAKKAPIFLCRYTGVDEAAACHGLTIGEAELEKLIYETIVKQARVLLNVEYPASAGRLDIQLAEQTEYERQIERCMEQKRILYERLISQEIGMEDYKKQKAEIDVDLDRWEKLRAALVEQSAQTQKEEASRSLQMEMAQEAVRADGLTAALVGKLLERVYVHPNREIEIIWKSKDFCVS